jgi:hypothetical protein
MPLATFIALADITTIVGRLEQIPSREHAWAVIMKVFLVRVLATRVSKRRANAAAAIGNISRKFCVTSALNGLSKQRMGDDEKDYPLKHFAFNAESSVSPRRLISTPVHNIYLRWLLRGNREELPIPPASSFGISRLPSLIHLLDD